MKEILGIIGGMGSHATVSMFQQIINHSPARKDQEYMEIMIHNNSRIPDRTEGILGHGDDPFPEICRSAKLLEDCGATILVLACITAHHYSEKLESSLGKAHLFHIVKETVAYTRKLYPDLKRAGVLATEGTIKSKLWEKEFRMNNIDTVVLSEEEQADYFTNVIYGPQGVKAGFRNEQLKDSLLEGCHRLVSKGAEVIIGACSELPLLIAKEDVQVPYIDAIQVAIEKLTTTYYQ
ncbi:aspartate/glutamate racemase family protein [Brevibacillus sp. SYSU BS000544]|uniref:aspartate/glutamate racemase family protein n=1 Tax=Brevibacillus sp. SYSU BS000544 TaxID=3416443 RepID=UPI003CE5BD04